MADINSYANDRLIEFTDAMHECLTDILIGEFGEDWLEQGVRKHFPDDYFARIAYMIQNPMSVVDMGKDAQDLHGLEHFWNIVNGNWKQFGDYFQDRKRTEVYLGEIAELRHNLSHRRGHHILLKSDLVRIMGNCKMALAALGSNHAETFAGIVDSLSSGVLPWGEPLGGYLPSTDEMYAEFVGRPDELDALANWLSSDIPQILVWGYGGAGKSALAYKFAHDVRDSAGKGLDAVCWVSAKKSEYVEGSARIRSADFSDTEGLVSATWSAIYGGIDSTTDLDPSKLIDELRDMPVLLVVDDFDTVSEDEDLSSFLLHGVRNTRCKVVYTSRHRVPGIRNLEVPPFNDEELSNFISLRASEYSVDKDLCLRRAKGIKSVTGGYPLFVDDLIHHAALVGIDRAVQHWSQRKGDAAREYALRRQVEYLGRSSGEVLIALSVANRALLPQEISSIAGLTDSDAESGLRELLRWRMVNQVTENDSISPAYRMNNNTGRLVQQTYRDDNRLNTYATAFKALNGERVPEAKRRAISRITSRTKQLEEHESFEDAKSFLLESMTGELSDSAELYGVLGWLCSKQKSEQDVIEARDAFSKSHQLGASKIDTYFHWVNMEKNIAESMLDVSDRDGKSAEAVTAQWQKCERIAEMGIQRCGSSQLLCYWAGYAASREAKSRVRANNFSNAQGAYTRAANWYSRALTAPLSDVSRVSKGAILRGLALAFEGLEDEDKLHKTLMDWHTIAGRDPYFQSECARLTRRFRILQNVPEFLRLAAVPTA